MSRPRKASAKGKGARRGPDHQALGRMESALLADLGEAGVREAQFVVAFEEPFAFRVWLATATDAERDALATAADVEGRVREAARRTWLADLYDGVRIESQETVDRDYAGNWLVRLQS